MPLNRIVCLAFILHSPLSGNDLVAAKVKRVVWQGGWYPPIHGWGVHTYNWDCGQGFYDTDGCNGASQYAVNNMPASVEMVYSDVGDEVISGIEFFTKYVLNVACFFKQIISFRSKVVHMCR